MPSLSSRNGNNVVAPHTVILGAGASIAMTILNEEMFAKKLPSMDNLVEVVGLEDLLNSYGVEYEGKNFESLFEKLKSEVKYNELCNVIEEQIYNYFASMEISNELTIYDYLIMSLSDNDAIATFNWDPFLMQALARCSRYTHNLPRLIHLHGNTGIGICYKDSIVGHIWAKCGTCKESLEPTPLLYPIGKKNYTANSWLKDEWNTVQDYLKNSFYVTIFGYSAPVSDIEAKDLLLKVWKENRSQELAQMEIIDIRPHEELYDTWKDFIVRDHYSITNNIFDSYLFRYPRRSCAAFFEMICMLRPHKENPFPKFDTLSQLYSWVKHLIEEEESGEKYNFEVLS